MSRSRHYVAEAKLIDEVIDYELDWTARLDEGETLVGEPVLTASADLVITESETTGAVTRMRVSAGRTPESTIDVLADTSLGQKIGARIRIGILPR